MMYDREFFDAQNGAVRSARKILPLVFDILHPRTLVDVGCGIGAWAKAAKDLGCVVTGLDGDWVPRDRLLIEQREFRSIDLEHPPQFPDRFDLVVSLEVAEHLSKAVAEKFVRFVTGLAPVVLFSAAIPFQRGTGHINEQYPTYWVDLFGSCGFEPRDVIRPACWYDRDIEFYYRQNVLLFVDGSCLSDLPISLAATTAGAVRLPLDVVHPDAVPILAQGWIESVGTMKCFELLRRSAGRAIRKRLMMQPASEA